MLKKYLLNKLMIFHSPCNWFGIHSIHKEKILHNSNNYLNLLSDFLTYTSKYIFKEIISLILTYLSYNFINIVRKHQYFREFILENAALDYSASRCNGIQLEHSWVKVFWRSVSPQISPKKGRKDMCTFKVPTASLSTLKKALHSPTLLQVSILQLRPQDL